MLAFAVAYLFMILTPGPGVMTTAGVGAGFGFRSGLRYVTGLFLGNFAVGMVVISGLWALVATIPYARQGLGLMALAYLLYLAWRVATAGAQVGFSSAQDAPGLRHGFALQLINPKAYTVNTLFFANFPLFAQNWPLEVLVKLVIGNLIWVPVHLVWLWAGVQLHRLNLPEVQQRRINYAMAVALVMVVLLAMIGVSTKS